MSFRLDKMLTSLRSERIELPPYLKQKIMTAIRADGFSLKRQRHIWRYAIGFAVFLLISTSGTVLASQTSIPGNVLYPVKRVSETAYLGLQPNERARMSAREVLIDRRFSEADSIAELNLANELIEDSFITDVEFESDEWINAQERLFSNDIEVASFE